MTEKHKNPLPTVDIIIELAPGGMMPNGMMPSGMMPSAVTPSNGIVLIERKNPPYGWAIPGGFVDAGESLEDAARREAIEETSLSVRLVCQMHAYSDPGRDPRFHTVSVVFVAEAPPGAEPVARDDARAVGVFTEDTLPAPLAFDHAEILKDYFRWKREGFRVFGPK
ncbi:MAG: NUDIX hydrolase [Thermodesulfobacteriota bacterium]